MNNIDEIGFHIIEKVKKVVALDKSVENRDILIEQTMDEFYNHFSKYDERLLNDFNLQIELFEVEQLLCNEFLPINTTPEYNSNDIINPKDENELLEYIVHCTREELSKNHNLETDSLSKECPQSSFYVERLCSELNVKFIHIGVNHDIRNGMFHLFTIVSIDNNDGTCKNYLIDCTYRQFFTKNNSNPRRIGVMRGPAKGCSIGSYMMLTDRRKEIAETLLTKGYIELTPEVFKEYFDAIVYSGRDKDYYASRGLDYLNPDDVISHYSVKDYLDLLLFNGIINQNDYIILTKSLEKYHSDLGGKKI